MTVKCREKKIAPCKFINTILMRELPVPLVALSVADPLSNALPLVLLDVIVDDIFDVDDGCGFSTIYLDLISWTDLLKLFTSS